MYLRTRVKYSMEQVARYPRNICLYLASLLIFLVLYIIATITTQYDITKWDLGRYNYATLLVSKIKYRTEKVFHLPNIVNFSQMSQVSLKIKSKLKKINETWSWYTTHQLLVRSSGGVPKFLINSLSTSHTNYNQFVVKSKPYNGLW